VATSDSGKRGVERGTFLRSDADRVDRFRLAVVEVCRRKGPIHSSARIDVAAVVAHVRHRFLRIKIDRRRMTVDNVFRERSLMTKEAVAYPKLGFVGLLVKANPRTNPRMNIITEFVVVAGWERAHHFLRSPELGDRSDNLKHKLAGRIVRVEIHIQDAKGDALIPPTRAASSLVKARRDARGAPYALPGQAATGVPLVRKSGVPFQ
jgi:hypothetical protein